MLSQPPASNDPSIRLLPAVHFTLDELTEAYNQTRVDYLIPMGMNAARLSAYLRLYDVDLERSWVAVAGGEKLGLAMLGVRPGRAWVTRLGVLPASRKHGVGEMLVRALLENAQGAGRTLSILEVIRENGRAHALFSKLGFVETRELLVLRRPPGPLDVTAEEQAEWLEAEEALDLLSSHTVRLPWTNELETYFNAGDARGLRVELPPAGAEGHASGWMVFRLHGNTLSHLVLHTTSGSPHAVCRALIAAFYQRFPRADSSVENLPADDPHAPELARLGFAEQFRRIEMHRQSDR